jgi:hypothetical protein
LFDKLEPWQRNRYLEIATETVDAGVEFFNKQMPALFKQYCEEKGGKYRPADDLHYCIFRSGMYVVSRIYRGRHQFTDVYPDMITAEYYEAAKRVLVKRFGEPNFKWRRPVNIRITDPPVWQWSDTKDREGNQRDWKHPFKVRVGRTGVEFYKDDVGKGGPVCPLSVEEVSECL